MLEIIKNIIFAILGISGFVWLFSTQTPWQALAKKYRTEKAIPDTSAVAQNQRVSFKGINTNGSLALVGLVLGVSEDGLYLANASLPLFSEQFFPALLIPWSDITYRKIIPEDFFHNQNYYTFYLGNPQIASFSVSSETIEQLERDYGEPIFSNKLGDANQNK